LLLHRRFLQKFDERIAIFLGSYFLLWHFGARRECRRPTSNNLAMVSEVQTISSFFSAGVKLYPGKVAKF
jgi:hypothetical protein